MLVSHRNPDESSRHFRGMRIGFIGSLANLFRVGAQGQNWPRLAWQGRLSSSGLADARGRRCF